MWEVSRAVRERDRAVLVLKGKAWYLRKQIGGKRRDHALKVYGGEAGGVMARRITITRQQLKSPDNLIGEAIHKARQSAGLVHYQPRTADDAEKDR